MKKLNLLTFVSLLLLSCSANNDGPNYCYKINPIDSFIIPTTFKLGKTYEITIKFTRLRECYFYQEIYYNKDLNVRTIAMQTAIDKNQACVQTVTAQTELTFNLYVTNTSS